MVYDIIYYYNIIYTGVCQSSGQAEAGCSDKAHDRKHHAMA